MGNLLLWISTCLDHRKEDGLWLKQLLLAPQISDPTIKHTTPAHILATSCTRETLWWDTYLPAQTSTILNSTLLKNPTHTHHRYPTSCSSRSSTQERRRRRTVTGASSV